MGLNWYMIVFLALTAITFWKYKSLPSLGGWGITVVAILLAQEGIIEDQVMFYALVTYTILVMMTVVIQSEKF